MWMEISNIRRRYITGQQAIPKLCICHARFDVGYAEYIVYANLKVGQHIPPERRRGAES